MRYLPLLLCAVFSLFAEVDLEANPDPFVLDLKKIEIPDYPYAFNPSIIRFEEKYLMSFRTLPDPKDNYVSSIGLVFLDDKFDPLGAPQILMTRNPLSKVPSRAEDGRLLYVGDRLYLIYSDNENPVITGGGFRLYLGELRYDG